jgi:hypothetical protein
VTRYETVEIDVDDGGPFGVALLQSAITGSVPINCATHLPVDVRAHECGEIMSQLRRVTTMIFSTKVAPPPANSMNMVINEPDSVRDRRLPTTTSSPFSTTRRAGSFAAERLV